MHGGSDGKQYFDSEALRCEQCGVISTDGGARLCAGCGAKLPGPARPPLDQRTEPPVSVEDAHPYVAPLSPNAYPNPLAPDTQALGPLPWQPLDATRRPGKRRGVLALIVVLIAGAGIAIGVITTSGGGGGGSPSPSGSRANTVVAALPDVCTLESNVVLDVWLGGGGTSAVDQTIGIENPVFGVANASASQFDDYELQHGIQYAERNIPPVLRSNCLRGGNPILTQDQVNALEQVASGPDASQLQQIQNFAP